MHTPWVCAYSHQSLKHAAQYSFVKNSPIFPCHGVLCCDFSARRYVSKVCVLPNVSYATSAHHVDDNRRRNKGRNTRTNKTPAFQSLCNVSCPSASILHMHMYMCICPCSLILRSPLHMQPNLVNAPLQFQRPAFLHLPFVSFCSLPAGLHISSKSDIPLRIPCP